ncbi:MAG: helix-turn-helix domain-containing protein [Streptococcaceae bacterium]|jgi:transcriptional regulator with XRE-family HTH domain|nr:helix-turn-helix domain-containing protein [Streptococcaceae bacterium]
MIEFGKVIKVYRKERKLTQKALANGICSQSVLSRIESGEEIPNVLVLKKLCDKLEISMDNLLSYAKKETREVQDFFELLWVYFRSQDINLLKETMEDSAISSKLVTVKEKQIFLFFEGFLTLELDKDYKQVTQIVTQALDLSYYSSKKQLSFIELMILAIRAQAYYKMNLIELAQNDFYKAMESIHVLPKESQEAELSILFYYFSDFLYALGQFSESQIHIKQGIRWLRNFESIFYLEKILLLNARILMKNKEENEANIYQTLAQDLNRLCRFLG